MRVSPSCVPTTAVPGVGVTASRRPAVVGSCSFANILLDFALTHISFVPPRSGINVFKSFLFNITLLCKTFPRPLFLERKMLLQFPVLSYSRLRCTGYSGLILSNEAHCFLYIEMSLNLCLPTKETNAQYETWKSFLVKH